MHNWVGLGDSLIRGFPSYQNETTKPQYKPIRSDMFSCNPFHNISFEWISASKFFSGVHSSVCYCFLKRCNTWVIKRVEHITPQWRTEETEKSQNILLCTITLNSDKDLKPAANPWDVPVFLCNAKRKVVHAHTHPNRLHILHLFQPKLKQSTLFSFIRFIIHFIQQ